MKGQGEKSVFSYPGDHSPLTLECTCFFHPDPSIWAPVLDPEPDSGEIDEETGLRLFPAGLLGDNENEDISLIAELPVITASNRLTNVICNGQPPLQMHNSMANHSRYGNGFRC